MVLHLGKGEEVPNGAQPGGKFGGAGRGNGRNMGTTKLNCPAKSSNGKEEKRYLLLKSTRNTPKW